MLTVSTQLSPTDDKTQFLAMLDSVAFADEILIFCYRGSDTGFLSRSSVRSRMHLVPVPPVPVVEYLRQRQVRKAKSDWVLILDFDEIVTPTLAAEIKAAVGAHDYSAFYVTRRNYSLGYPLTHGGWAGDRLLRLFRRSAFRSWPPSIHSTPVFDGSAGQLKHALEHHKDHSLSYMVGKTNVYSDAEAALFEQGGMAPVTGVTLLRKPFLEFCRRYFLSRGFLDGPIGLIQSLYQGYSVFLTYAKLYERQQKKVKTGAKAKIKTHD